MILPVKKSVFSHKNAHCWEQPKQLSFFSKRDQTCYCTSQITKNLLKLSSSQKSPPPQQTSTPRADQLRSALAVWPASRYGRVICPKAWRAAQLGRTSTCLDPQTEQCPHSIIDVSGV